jgi:hypothetical protein
MPAKARVSWGTATAAAQRSTAALVAGTPTPLARQVPTTTLVSPVLMYERRPGRSADQARSDLTLGRSNQRTDRV